MLTGMRVQRRYCGVEYLLIGWIMLSVERRYHLSATIRPHLPICIFLSVKLELAIAVVLFVLSVVVVAAMVARMAGR